jgi:hypothetical protein
MSTRCRIVLSWLQKEDEFTENPADEHIQNTAAGVEYRQVLGIDLGRVEA